MAETVGALRVELSATSAAFEQDMAKVRAAAGTLRPAFDQIGKSVAAAGAAMRQAALGMTGGLSDVAAIASSSAAVLSKFTKGNDELREKLEGLATNLAIAAPAIRGFGAAIRFATGPVGAIITAIGAAIAIFVNWETVQRAVVQAVQAAWKGLGDFFGQLFGSISTMAAGIGQVLLGAFTLDMGRIQEGVGQLKQGLGDLGQIGIDMGQSLAAGFHTAVGAAQDFIGVTRQASEAAKESAAQILEAYEGSAGAMLENQIAAIRAGMEAEKQAAQERRELAATILEAHEAGQNALLESTLARIRAEREAEVLQAEQRRVEAAEILAAHEAAENAKLEMTVARIQQEIAAEQQRNAMVLGSIMNSLGIIFAQSKEFAIAQAIIRTAVGVTEALSMWWLYPLNLVNAALMAAAGAVQIGTIMGTELAEGGIVTRETMALIGEAGPEAVIPLDRFDQFQERRPVMHLTFELDGRALGKYVTEFIPGHVRVAAGLRTA
jgi:hypothetical protein